jgi:uncharacterized Rmd1/YagE family protein
MRCASYCTAESYEVDDLAKSLREQGLDPKFYDNVIHIEKSIEEGTGHIFFFPYGCIVFWGVDSDVEAEFLSLVTDFSQNPILHPIYDESFYGYGESTTIIEESDEMILESEDSLLMLSFSYGLSQSVKLTAFEESINKTIQATRELPEELAKGGATSLSRRQLSKKIGALFAERHSINLHNDILDTPEFFWRRPKYEPYYLMSAQYMDITTRMEILNRRLGVIHELYEILSDELKHLHSSRLEMTIIFLIVIEVLLAIVKDILKWI